MNKIQKASVAKNPNRYIWIWRTKEGILLTDKKIKLKLHDKEQGIAFYWKDKEENILVWRFKRSKGWTENVAKLFAISFAPSPTQVEEALKTINEWDGQSQLLKNSIRKSIHGFLKPYIKEYEIVKNTDLKTQFIYKNNKVMQDKMKKLAKLSNKRFHEFIEDAQKARMDVVKNTNLLDKTKEKGFKFHGVVKAYKEVVKNEDGKDTEKWLLKTTFTSNKADLHDDLTSAKAIKKAVSNLNKRGMIPIRFEHGADDYGVWSEFKTYKSDGVLFGEAIGELDQKLSRSKDLWTEIYEYGKQFATSYGGNWVEFHWYADEDTGNVLRVFDEVVVEEISLTTHPANPDTALDTLNKYAEKLESTLDDSVLNKFISKNSMAKEDLLNKDQEESASEKDTLNQTDAENAEAKAPEAAAEAAPTTEEVKGDKQEVASEGDEADSKEEKSKEVNDNTVITKSLTEIVKSVSEIAKSLEAMDSRITKMEGQPEQPAAIAKADGAGSEANINEDEEAIKKAYPMQYSLMKAQGVFNK